MTDSAIRLDAPQVLRTRVGWELPSVAFALVLHPAPTTFLLDVELSGAALQLIDVTLLEYAALAGSTSGNEPVHTVELRGHRATFPVTHASPIGAMLFGFLRVRARAHSEGTAPLVLRVSAHGLTTFAETRVEVEEAVRLPLLPQPIEPSVFADAWLESRCDAYNARTWAVGAFSFDAGFEQLGEWLLHWMETLATLARDVNGAHALDVSIAADGPTESLPSLGTGDSLIGPSTIGILDVLQRGGLLRVARPGVGTIAEIVLRHRPNEESTSRSTRLDFAWAIPRPGSESDQQRLAESMRRFTDEACLIPECVAAIATASGPPHHSLPSPFPYEELASRAGLSTRLDWVRRHVRSPGWRTLVPRAAVDARLPAHCESKQTAAGLLLMADTDDPFSMSEEALAAIERCVLPYMGTAQEFEELLHDK